MSRISGDEFVVVALDIDAEGAAALGERLRSAFEHPLDIGNEHHITVSAGVAHAIVATRRDWAADLTRDADTAMYRSKDRGGNAVTVFDDSMREQVARRLSIESELRRAFGARRARSALPARSCRSRPGRSKGSKRWPLASR